MMNGPNVRAAGAAAPKVSNNECQVGVESKQFASLLAGLLLLGGSG